MALALFVAALAIIVWVYVGYPLLLWAMALLRRKPVRRAPVAPTVSLVICAYNEERDIRRKLQECVAADYPPDRLEIVVASDGSTDRTDDIVREFAPRVRLLRVEGRGGKTVAQNAAVAEARGDILVFSDVTTVYTPTTIREMVANFADPAVGCVGGDLHYEKEPRNTSAEGRALFWGFERQLRVWESQVHSIVGVAGCVYAMRRALYVPLDAAAISDFVQPGRVTERGHRTVLEPRALAFEAAESRSLGEELHRRARVITRGLRGAFTMPALLNPLRHPWFATLLWSHRVLRWLVPVFLLVLLAASVALAPRGPFFQLVLAAQLAMYGSGLVAYTLERLRVRPPGLFIPLYFCVLNLAPLLALAWLVRGEKKVAWETGR
ncbi:MAG TPA: glycosyltransferase family 2 protein [Candidatus Eisenbacteria bacterium]|nr:glycosyltransferase family 2 protein [Candidatus Eisenbacteria bacterium]